MDLSEKYRPGRFADMWQWPKSPSLIATTREIQNGGIASPMLIVADYGEGKTTLARIIGRRACCENADDHSFEPCLKCAGCEDLKVRSTTTWCGYGYFEIDCSQLPAPEVQKRATRESMMSPFGGWRRWVICLDEIGRRDKTYQRNLLKLVENVRAHFILCSGSGDDIDRALRSRCVVRPLKPPNRDQCLTAIKRIATAEEVAFENGCGELLVTRLGCNPRTILKVMTNALALSDCHIGIDEVEAALEMQS